MDQLRRMAAHFPTNRTDKDWKTVQKDYCDFLMAYPLDEIEAECERQIQTSDYFPKPRDILEPLRAKARVRDEHRKIMEARTVNQISTAEYVKKNGIQKFREVHFRQYGKYPNEEKLRAALEQ